MASFFQTRPRFGGFDFTGNSFGQALGRIDNPLTKGIYGLGDMPEDEETRRNVWQGFMAHQQNAGNPFALNQWTNTYGKQRLDNLYLAAQAEDPNVKYADLVGMVNPMNAWWMADPRSAGRNPFYQAVRFRSR